MSALTRETYCTYENWLDMENPDGVWKMELIDGALYMMSAPSTAHQGILADLIRQFASYLLDKTCRVYPGIGVRLAKDTVYIPDITVICDMKKITKEVCEGSPDLIIEILSPSNIRHDTITKYNAYLNARVNEYWIVNPEERSVFVYRLKDGFYTVSVYDAHEIVPVMAFPDFELNLATVFQD